MILVAVGTSQFPFDRLLRAVDGLETAEALVVQHGSSDVRPARARCYPFLPFEELTALVREARVFVTHAGVGSILLSLTNGKRPFVVPRLRSFGETVDDHQLESARRFAKADLVTLVEEPRELAAVISGAPVDERTTENGLEGAGGTNHLRAELRSYLAAIVGPPRPEAAR